MSNQENVKFNYVECYGKGVNIQVISEGVLTPMVTMTEEEPKEATTTYLDILMLAPKKYQFMPELEDDLVEKLIDKFGGELYDILHFPSETPDESLATYLVSEYFEDVDYTDIEDDNYNVRRIVMVLDKFEEYIPEMIKKKNDTVTIIKFSII